MDVKKMGPNKSKVKRLPTAEHLTRSLKGAFTSQDDIDVNALYSTPDNEVVTPMWLAARNNDLELAEVLLKAGAKVNVSSGSLNMAPLHLASYSHNIAMVTMLLKYGANPNVLDVWNYSPLMYAAIHFESGVVEELFKLLISAGAVVNFGATLGSIRESRVGELPALQSAYAYCMTYIREPLGPISGTALHLAMQNHHLPADTLLHLINAGANVNIRNLHGQPPLIGAIMDVFYDYHYQIPSHVDLLIERGADVNIPDVRGWTAVHYACQRGSVSCMQLLLRAGADSNHVSNVGESPLWLLLAHGWHEATSYLISSGCDLNQPLESCAILAINQTADLCRYGNIKPIEFAICNRFYNIAELLIKCGCSITKDTWLGNRRVSPDEESQPDELADIEPVNQYHAAVFSLAQERLRSRTKVCSLQEHCRRSLRVHLSQAIFVKLDQIELPNSLKSYLTYSL